MHLSIDGNAVGDTTADGSGAFSTPLQVGSLPVGRYRVDAACGVALAAPLDVVLVSDVSSATSTLTIIIFVLLIGLLIYRRRLVAHVLNPPAEPAGPEEPAEQ